MPKSSSGAAAAAPYLVRAFGAASGPAAQAPGQLVDLGALGSDARDALLSGWRASKARVECICALHAVEPGQAPELFVVERLGQFHLRRKPEGRAEHRFGCRHHEIGAAELERMGLTKAALRTDDNGLLHVSLDAALSLPEGASAQPGASAESRQCAESAAGASRARMGLLGLLYVLWSAARLDEFDEHASPRDAHELWLRLWQASSRTLVNAGRQAPSAPADARVHPASLGGSFLLPTGDDPRQRVRNWARLRAASNERRRLACAFMLDRQMLDEDVGAELELRSIFGPSVRLPTSALARALDSTPASRSDAYAGASVVLFGLARPQGEGRALGAIIERLVALRLSDRFVPVASGYERLMAQALQDLGRRFVKPLRYDARADVLPDFVLLDVEPACPVEVYGMDTPAYLERKQAKRALYDASAAGHAAWDAKREPLAHAIERLPRPMRRPMPVG